MTIKSIATNFIRLCCHQKHIDRASKRQQKSCAQINATQDLARSKESVLRGAGRPERAKFQPSYTLDEGKAPDGRRAFSLIAPPFLACAACAARVRVFPLLNTPNVGKWGNELLRMGYLCARNSCACVLLSERANETPVGSPNSSTLFIAHIEIQFVGVKSRFMIEP